MRNGVAALFRESGGPLVGAPQRGKLLQWTRLNCRTVSLAAQYCLFGSTKFLCLGYRCRHVNPLGMT